MGFEVAVEGLRMGLGGYFYGLTEEKSGGLGWWYEELEESTFWLSCRELKKIAIRWIVNCLGYVGILEVYTWMERKWSWSMIFGSVNSILFILS